MALTIVFVHGYSVTNLNTYGEMPLRLRAEAQARGVDLKIEEIFLGRYISFDDTVVLDDISRAFQTAIKQQLTDPADRFICITHSTGGPVIRNWWNIYYNNNPAACPLSHLIMLAPANYGSALAQLGKGTLSRLKSWFDGVEPGQGVLNWLELGSAEAWELNTDWIANGEKQITDKGVFPFVITGQDIDRKLYDHLNSYTGEIGSDGVMRAAATNLQANYIRLTQTKPQQNAQGKFMMGKLELTTSKQAVPTPFRIVTCRSHSGTDMGVMASVSKDVGGESAETVNVIFDCISVQNRAQYDALITKFNIATQIVQNNTKVEIKTVLGVDRTYIHDRFSMVIFRVTDSDGRPVTDFDLILTAGPNSDPNHLPPGFFADRQCNRLNKNTLTYFFNYDIMQGSPPVKNPKNGKILREETKGAQMLGFQLKLRPNSGFVQYVPCEIIATQEMLQQALHPNSTTLIDICVQRVIDQEVFRLVALGGSMPTKAQGNFKNVTPSNKMVD